jgi:t-SNARE complex subunit (syntaxin)
MQNNDESTSVKTRDGTTATKSTVSRTPRAENRRARFHLILLVLLVLFVIAFYFGVVEFFVRTCVIVGYRDNGSAIYDCPGP